MSKRAKIQTASRGMDSHKTKESIQKSRRKSGTKTGMGTEIDSSRENKTVMCAELSQQDACETEGENGTVQRQLRETNKVGILGTIPSGDRHGLEMGGHKQLERTSTTDIDNKDNQPLKRTRLEEETRMAELEKAFPKIGKLLQKTTDMFLKNPIPTKEVRQITWDKIVDQLEKISFKYGHHSEVVAQVDEVYKAFKELATAAVNVKLVPIVK